MSVASLTTRQAAAASLLQFVAGLALAQSPVPVQVVMPEVGQAIQTLELSGSITPRRAAALSSRVSGLVAEVNVDAGDRVEAGAVLLRLDGKLASLAVAEAEAALGQSQAALREAQRLRDEGQRLVRDNFVSETEVAALESRFAVAEAALAQSTSQLQTARERVARHDVIAPFAGVISRKLTEAGEWVETGTPVADLVGTEELWLDVQAPQQYWPELVPESEVSVELDAIPGRTFEAYIHARVPVSDPTARTFLVRLQIEGLEESSNLITPGMSGRARFSLPGSQEVVRVPRDALIRYPDGTTTVWIVEQSNTGMRARELEVTVGRASGDSIEIISRLDPLRPVVVRGNEVLTQDQVVRVSNES